MSKIHSLHAFREKQYIYMESGLEENLKSLLMLKDELSRDSIFHGIFWLPLYTPFTLELSCISIYGMCMYLLRLPFCFYISHIISLSGYLLRQSPVKGNIWDESMSAVLNGR